LCRSLVPGTCRAKNACLGRSNHFFSRRRKKFPSLPIISLVPTCFSCNPPGKHLDAIVTVLSLLVVRVVTECLLELLNLFLFLFQFSSHPFTPGEHTFCSCCLVFTFRRFLFLLFLWNCSVCCIRVNILFGWSVVVLLLAPSDHGERPLQCIVIFSCMNVIDCHTCHRTCLMLGIIFSFAKYYTMNFILNYFPELLMYFIVEDVTSLGYNFAQILRLKTWLLFWLIFFLWKTFSNRTFRF